MTEHDLETYQGWSCADNIDRSLDYSSCYGKTECWKVKIMAKTIALIIDS